MSFDPVYGFCSTFVTSQNMTIRGNNGKRVLKGDLSIFSIVTTWIFMRLKE